MYLTAVGIGLLIAAALYTLLLSTIRNVYEPDNTHWAATGGIALILIAFWALCDAGPLPLIGDLPIEALHTMHALCWIAFLPVLIWREGAKFLRRRERARANQRKS